MDVLFLECSSDRNVMGPQISATVVQYLNWIMAHMKETCIPDNNKDNKEKYY